MKTFSINTLGCKVNQYETQQIRELLIQHGLSQVESAAKSDLIIVNTCCVTHTASAKSRQYIHKAQNLNPYAFIVVAGCLPAVPNDELSIDQKNTYLIKHRKNLTRTLGQIVGKIQTSHEKPIKAEKQRKIKPKTLSISPELPQLTSFSDQTRAFLKVQDGCDGFCSYCIVPTARPVVQSRDQNLIIKEAQDLVNAGHKEIVLTGIFLGAYGLDSVRRKKWPEQQNDKLAELIENLAKIPDLARIRLSSLEPGDITERLLDAFCRNHNIMPHLHLSLQSGSTAILKKMCRQYTIDDFLDKVEMAKSRLDRPAITTDLIVGFPGETETDFAQTIDIAKRVGFAKIHVFSFSPRKGTAAAAMQDTVNNGVIKQRSRILRELDRELGYEFRQQFVGQRATVLVERAKDGASGHSERYFNVSIAEKGEKVENNALIEVQLTENTAGGMVGEMS